MKQELVIAPSILSLDFSRMSEQLKELAESKAAWIHFDVMDGHFVPNLTFGPDILKGVKKALHQVMDVHLMVTNPVQYADVFMDAGADIITFHVEALSNMEEVVALCRHIRSRDVKAGVSVKPNTSIDCILPYLEEMDLVLVMSVEPGFGGQKFQEQQLEKVRILRAKIDERNLQVRIEIDGGIQQDTGKLAIEAGCDALVAGSYVFKHNVKEAVETLLCQQ